MATPIIEQRRVVYKGSIIAEPWSVGKYGDENYRCRWCSYFSYEGFGVRIFQHTGILSNDIEERTDLTVNIFGTQYSRRYKKVFNTHGLSMVAAAFVKDVLMNV